MITLTRYLPADYHETVMMWNRAGLGLTLSDIESEVRRFADHNPETFLLLREDDKIIGSVIGAFDGRRAYIYHLAVDPELHGQGLGRKLMEHITQYFKELGVVKIHLMVDRSNEKVVPFYEHLGWVVRDDIILMSKSLRTDKIEVSEDRVELKD